MRATTRNQVVLDLWDFFYIRNTPGRGEEKTWGAIERATCRIRDAEVYLDEPTPADVRLRNAQRMRSAVRVARRNIDRLAAKPERWIVDRLAELEAVAVQLIRDLSDEARLLVLD
jgi:hypothetical protein